MTSQHQDESQILEVLHQRSLFWWEWISVLFYFWGISNIGFWQTKCLNFSKEGEKPVQKHSHALCIAKGQLILSHVQISLGFHLI